MFYSIEFTAHPLFRGGHLQTIAGYLFASGDRFEADELRKVALEQGDSLTMEINHPRHSPAKAMIFMFHGLGGSSESGYMIRLAKVFSSLGWMVIRCNHRGCGRHSKSSDSFYHSGSVDDMLAAIKAIHQEYTELPFVTVGFSLSGTILLNLLGRKPDICAQMDAWKAAISVCAPIDLDWSSRSIDNWNNLLYDQFFKILLMRQTRSRYPKVYRDFLNDQKVYIRGLRHFDEVITAPFGGFKDRDDYYWSCSPKCVVSRIAKPTLVLAAADDPIVPMKSVIDAPYSRCVELLVAASGGHIGFISKARPFINVERWLESAMPKLANQMLSQARFTEL